MHFGIAIASIVLGNALALPPGIYIADGWNPSPKGNQYYNPTREPHTLINITVNFSTNTGEQRAISTGHYAYFIGGSPNRIDVRVISLHSNNTLAVPPLRTGRWGHAAALFQNSSTAFLQTCLYFQ